MIPPPSQIVNEYSQTKRRRLISFNKANEGSGNISGTGITGTERGSEIGK